MWLGLITLFVVIVGCSSAVDQAGESQQQADEVASARAAEEAEVATADETVDDDGDNEPEPTTTTAPEPEAEPEPEPEVEAEPEVESEPEAMTVDFSDTEYSTHIHPILERSCASCHAPGQAGSDHFELDTAGDAQAAAAGIQLFTDSRTMPPWPASQLSPKFVGDQSLSDEEVARIRTWAEAGGEIDVDPTMPVEPTQPPSFLEGEDRDIVMTAHDGPYEHQTDIVDEYRCLVFEPGNEKLEFITAAGFEPDQTEIAHHAIVTLVSGELRDQVTALEAQDPAAGWSCYGGVRTLDTSAGGSVQRLNGWAPGGQPQRLPEGYAIALQPDDFVVVQMHYHYDGATPADNSRYILGLASDEDLAANPDGFKVLTNNRYLGPAEIPCYEGDTHPLCDRDAALQRVRDLYGGFVGAFPNFFLNQCGATVEDFAHMTDGNASSTCDLPVTNPGRIHSVNGHMHELGKSIRLTLNPDTPEERILLDIPDWDFEWQFGYEPVEDIIIDSDDIIRVDCSWNRERAPYEAVGYILWSDGTGDEMCFSGVTTRPVE